MPRYRVGPQRGRNRTRLVIDMTNAAVQPGGLPPELVGLDPKWSRLVTARCRDGDRTFHVLDCNRHATGLTVVCVHGNPSWSYLWRELLAAAPSNVRVIAPDHLNMGYSDRTDADRTLSDRIDDLGALTDALGIVGPVITIAHDWGGPISLGWAQRRIDQIRGLVLTNTAVSQPSDSTPPWLITTAKSARVLRTVTQRTPAFIRGALRLSSPEPAPDIRAGFMAPYDTPERRAGIRAFVADVPLEPSHASFETLESVAAGLDQLAEVPACLFWGTRDPVFGEQYLHDFERRLPHAQVHRFSGASHFVTEDAPVAAAFWDWVEALQETGETSDSYAPQLNRSLLPSASDASPLVVELGEEGWRSIEPDLFLERVGRSAEGLGAIGAKPGDRVAVMIPPGIDLTVVLYACWQAGLVAVLVDSGLGVKNMDRALRAAHPDWLIGIPAAVTAAKGLRWGGRRIVVGEMDSRLRSVLGIERSLREIEFLGESAARQVRPIDADAVAAVAFTSGSTGPSKGVVYKAGHIGAQRDAIAELYQITEADRLVAAFAPFALYGPALGVTSIVPAMDVTKPATLTAAALGEAAAQVDATMIFASPAALQNVVATAESLAPHQRAALRNVRLIMSAGAPLRLGLLQSVARLSPSAEIHTPYGMTEILPVADISLAVRLARGPGPGVCVGRPVPNVQVRIHPLDALGLPSESATDRPHILGEVVVNGPHLKESYDRLWWTEHRSRTADQWHRTGDIGHLDRDGFLWISGRVQHVITSPDGPIAPISIEHAAERVKSVVRAAAVGVGPLGGQSLVVVIETAHRGSNPLAPAAMVKLVRAELESDGLQNPVAVLQTPKLPVDRRHNSKVDRTKVAHWADKILAGGRPSRI